MSPNKFKVDFNKITQIVNGFYIQKKKRLCTNINFLHNYTVKIYHIFDKFIIFKNNQRSNNNL